MCTIYVHHDILADISCVFYVCHGVLAGVFYALYTCCWTYASLYIGTKWYVPVLTHPCSSMLHTCSGMSLVRALAKVQNLLKRGVEFSLHVALVTGGVVICPIVS